MRSVLVASNYDYPIIRIDTNQGVYGLGEVRDAGREGTALVLKPHLVGRNPLRHRADPRQHPQLCQRISAWAAATARSTWRCTTSRGKSTTCPRGG